MRSLLIKDLDSNRGKPRQTMSPSTQAMKKAKCSAQQRYITVVSLSVEVLQYVTPITRSRILLTPSKPYTGGFFGLF